MDLHRVGLGEDFATHATVEGFLLRGKIISWCWEKNISYFGVRSLMNDSLGRRPETLAAFRAGIWLGTGVNSFMNILETKISSWYFMCHLLPFCRPLWTFSDRNYTWRVWSSDASDCAFRSYLQLIYWSEWTQRRISFLTSTTQHFAADGTFEHFIGNPLGRFSFEPIEEENY